MPMQLHGPAFSNNVFRPLVVARHLSLELTVEPVEMRAGQHKSQDFLKMNPHGRIPVLIDGDYALWESMAIMQYLAAQQPNDWWPDDLRARATITSWQCWVASHLKPAVLPVQFERAMKPMFGMGETDQAVVDKALTAWATEGRVLDERLSHNNGWLVGTGPTLADIDAAGVLMYARMIQLPVDQLPAVGAWLAATAALPAWSQAMTEIQLPPGLAN